MAHLTFSQNDLIGTIILTGLWCQCWLLLSSSHLWIVPRCNNLSHEGPAKPLNQSPENSPRTHVAERFMAATINACISWSGSDHRILELIWVAHGYTQVEEIFYILIPGSQMDKPFSFFSALIYQAFTISHSSLSPMLFPQGMEEFENIQSAPTIGQLTDIWSPASNLDQFSSII